MRPRSHSPRRRLLVRFFDPHAFHSIGQAPTSDQWWRSSNNARLLDARTSFFYFATGISPAMVLKIVGGGSQYAIVTVDADDNYFDGGKTYRLHLPPNIPINNFWSVIPCDTHPLRLADRSAGHGTDSDSRTVKANADGSADIYFGPKAPAGKESNWIQTMQGEGWFTILRLYGALEPWFDKTWRPGEIELAK